MYIKRSQKVVRHVKKLLEIYGLFKQSWAELMNVIRVFLARADSGSGSGSSSDSDFFHFDVGDDTFYDRLDAIFLPYPYMLQELFRPSSEFVSLLCTVENRPAENRGYVVKDHWRKKKILEAFFAYTKQRGLGYFLLRSTHFLTRCGSHMDTTGLAAKAASTNRHVRLDIEHVLKCIRDAGANTEVNDRGRNSCDLRNALRHYWVEYLHSSIQDLRTFVLEAMKLKRASQRSECINAVFQLLAPNTPDRQWLLGAACHEIITSMERRMEANRTKVRADPFALAKEICALLSDLTEVTSDELCKFINGRELFFLVEQRSYIYI